MDCIILAGGYGTRLRPIIINRPKPLAEINGVPFLDIIFHQISRISCIERVILAIGYLAEQFVHRYQNEQKYGFQIDFSFEDVPLGTGGALKKALQRTTSPQVLGLNGDTYTKFDFLQFYATHLEREADFSLLYMHSKNTERYGSVVVDEYSGKIISLNEKCVYETNYINSGVYLLKRNLFNGVHLGDQFSLEKEAFSFFAGKNSFGCYYDGPFLDIGTPDSFLKAQRMKFE